MATAATGTSAPHRATGGVPGHRYAASFKEKKFPPIFLGHRKLPATALCTVNEFSVRQIRRRHKRAADTAPLRRATTPPLTERACAALTPHNRRRAAMTRSQSPL